ncbi:hypothetical protein LXL04_023408 [Taraxacum kok-saghyz]
MPLLNQGSINQRPAPHSLAEILFKTKIVNTQKRFECILSGRNKVKESEVMLKSQSFEFHSQLAGVMSSLNGVNISGGKERKDLGPEGITHQLILTQIDSLVPPAGVEYFTSTSLVPSLADQPGQVRYLWLLGNTIRTSHADNSFTCWF